MNGEIFRPPAAPDCQQMSPRAIRGGVTLPHQLYCRSETDAVRSHNLPSLLARPPQV